MIRFAHDRFEALVYLGYVALYALAALVSVALTGCPSSSTGKHHAPPAPAPQQPAKSTETAEQRQAREERERRQAEYDRRAREIDEQIAQQQQNGGAGGPSAPVVGPIQGPWTWASPGDPDERMIRVDSPGGIRCWVPEVWYQGNPSRFTQYLAALDTQPNEVGLRDWQAANPDRLAEGPLPGEVKTMLDAPQVAAGQLDVIICPRVKLVHWRDGLFFAGLTEGGLIPGHGYQRVWLTWPAEHDGRMERLIAHEVSHALGWGPGHPRDCPTCMGSGL